jgi:ABC-2 type transport system permease protein
VRAILVIAAKDLRQRFRDRSALILGFVAPLGIATLMSFAFQASEEFHANVGVVNADDGVLAGAFLGALEGPELAKVISVTPVDSVSDARDQVDRAVVDAAIVIPDGFSEAAAGGSPTPVDVLTSVDNPLAGEVARAIASAFVAQVNANRLSVATAIAAGASPARLGELLTAVSNVRLPEQTNQQPVSGKPLHAVSYYAPAMGIFFVLFAVGFTARSFFGEQRGGTLERMAAAPIRSSAILVGKAVSVFVYVLASLATVAVVTTVAFDADWGSPVATAAVCAAVAIAVVTLTAIVISAARTERQAEGLSSILVFALALLGGNFLFISAAPPLMRTLALGTPNGWALRAFTDLATTSGGLGHDLRLIAIPVLAIMLFSLVVGTIAIALSRRLVLR